MKTKRIAEIKNLSLSVMQHFHRQDIDFIMPLLHPDATWIRNEDDCFLCGKQSISEAFTSLRHGSVMPAAPVYCQAAYVLPGSSNICVVLSSHDSNGQYRQCVTFIWETDGRTHQLLHVHASLHEPDTTLKLNGITREHYYLQPSDIQYVEADNIYCYISCGKQAYHVNHPLILMEELLPDYFLRIHRSFLVNLYAIHVLRPHCLELEGGIQLPVPERKYLWLENHLNCRA